MVKWGKRHVELWKRKSILCALYIFTQVWVRDQCCFIWDFNFLNCYHQGDAPLIFVKNKNIFNQHTKILAKLTFSLIRTFKTK